ncbi:carboxymuconolactone decarboxylase family protein [Proteiniphilum sp. X52]|uniref:carboxymuconolactone decarboxylase family protein n=1 Tax=Proteiniphilum sp. X52 TaxID=2382159 RepID=UPI000F09E7F5|nr:carboxymuconolactone decarboxylase family protein [Proteiniphilum sp. X52]RNC65573.1 cupin domain-containing protein [Proteiniphilum sp. X52]
MKRTVVLVIAILTMVTVQGQRLAERQKGLAACACLMAQGDLERLEPAVKMALDNGVTINELKEAFSQLYAYAGFPRSLNALGVLNKVLENKQANWQEGKPWKRPAVWDNPEKALKLGTQVQTQLSGRAFHYDFCPQNDYYLKSHLFGDIFAGDQLSHADREIVTVAALSGLEGVAPQLTAHKQGAVKMGNSQELVDELCTWLYSEGYTLRSKWPKGELNTAYAQYFIGNSYLADVGGGVHNVTFEPCCRNNWHIHHKAVQVLICVSGRGWYQEWGKEAIEMTPGTLIAIPAEVKHWHGAAKDSWFQHLTYHKDVQEGSSNEWLEPVTDEEYNKLP